MDEAGYGPEVCAALDDGWTAFVEEFERMRDATVMVPMKERPKGQPPMVPAPKHTTAELLRALDIETGEDVPSSRAAQAAQPLTWEPIDWGDGVMG